MKKKRFALFSLTFFLILGTGSAFGQKGPLLKLEVEGIINPVIGEYIKDGMKEAEKINATAVLIQLNTPGGLLDATRTSITAMINSDIPVIVYVAPRGSRATSAGVFITIAADVAAMSPETHIGAAHPVSLTGDAPRAPDREEKKEDSKEKPATNKKEKPIFKKKPGAVMEEKMVSDAAAYIRTLAKERGRNAEWAERAVRESVSLTAKEALAQNVIDVVAASIPELMKEIDGRKIKKNEKEIVLNLTGVTVVDFKMSFARRFLHMLAHPNVAYILMTIGIYGLIYEFASPGIGAGGIVGVICLLLAFFSLQVLPINAVGLILIVFGMILLVMELMTPTNGILTIGGLVAFAFGSFMLIDVSKDLPYPRVSISLIMPTVAVTGLFFFFALRKVFEAKRRPATNSRESLVGESAEVRNDLNPEGLVYLHGELWSAVAEESIDAGEKVKVTGHQGNFLKVKKI